jgi:hypothetical protein
MKRQVCCEGNDRTKKTYVKWIARLIALNRTSCVRGRNEFSEVAKESGVQ